MARTQHYRLRLREVWGRPDWAGAKEDIRTVDAALGAKCELVLGSYTGDAAPERKIELGFTPKAVLVISEWGNFQESGSHTGGLALPGLPVRVARDRLPVVSVAEGGFLVYYEYSSYGTIGSNSGTHYYLAVR